MAADVVGREQELGALHAFLERDARRACRARARRRARDRQVDALARGRRAARDRGVRVLPSRPAEAERGLAYVGLGDLFDDVLEEVLPVLTPPRRRALEVALLLDEVPEEPVDPRALGVAVRTALEELARTRPARRRDRRRPVARRLLGACAAVRAATAARRADVRLLLARRTRCPPARGLEQAIDAEPSTSACRPAQRRCAAAVPATAARTGRSRAACCSASIERSGGNPFFALELARGLAAEGAIDPTEPLPVPESLDRLVARASRAAARATREALARRGGARPPTTALLRARASLPTLLDAGGRDAGASSSRRASRVSAIRCWRRRSTRARCPSNGAVSTSGWQSSSTTR